MTAFDGCVFQIWSQEDHTWLFRVENRRHAVVNVQRQLFAICHRTLSYWPVRIWDVLTGVRSR